MARPLPPVCTGGASEHALELAGVDAVSVKAEPARGDAIRFAHEVIAPYRATLARELTLGSSAP